MYTYLLCSSLRQTWVVLAFVSWVPPARVLFRFLRGKEAASFCLSRIVGVGKRLLFPLCLGGPHYYPVAVVERKRTQINDNDSWERAAFFFFFFPAGCVPIVGDVGIWGCGEEEGSRERGRVRWCVPEWYSVALETVRLSREPNLFYDDWYRVFKMKRRNGFTIHGSLEMSLWIATRPISPPVQLIMHPDL